MKKKSEYEQQTPEEGQRAYQLKHCRNNSKDEDNSLKTLNDKNHQALSQKFRQLILHKLPSANFLKASWSRSDEHLGLGSSLNDVSPEWNFCHVMAHENEEVGMILSPPLN